MDPGSFTSNSNEIYQEGLQLPGVKLYHKGELNDAVYEIISTNVRLPELSIGDMFAQVAALKQEKNESQSFVRSLVRNR